MKKKSTVKSLQDKNIMAHEHKEAAAMVKTSEVLHDFGVQDSRGRAIGYRVTFYTSGHFFEAITSPTRDRKDFGPITPTLVALTREGLAVLVRIRVQAAKARYMRQARKQAAGD